MAQLHDNKQMQGYIAGYWIQGSVKGFDEKLKEKLKFNLPMFESEMRFY